MVLATVEPWATAMFLLVLGLLTTLSVLFSRQIDRLGVPIVLLFLVLGMLGGPKDSAGLPLKIMALPSALEQSIWS